MSLFASRMPHFLNLWGGQLRRLLLPRFSLRTLMIVMTLGCVLLALCYKRVERVRDIRALRSMGSFVAMKNPFPTPIGEKHAKWPGYADAWLGDGFFCLPRRVALNQLNDAEGHYARAISILNNYPDLEIDVHLGSKRDFPFASLKALRGHPGVASVFVGKERESLPREEWEWITSFRGLKRLEVAAQHYEAELTGLSKLDRLDTLLIHNGSLINEHGWQEISDLTFLWKLAVCNARISATSMQSVCEMSSLAHLNLSGVQVENVADRRVFRYAIFDRLSFLNIEDSNITGQEVGDLWKFPQLEMLELSGCAIEDADLDNFAKFPALAYLDISRTRVTEQGLLRMKLPPTLANLSLWGLPIGKDVLMNLRNSVKLTWVEVGATKVSPQEAAGLNAANPDCVISVNPNGYLRGAAMFSPPTPSRR